MVDPERGEVWLVDLGFAAKIRPCVVLSVPPAGLNDRVLVTLVTHTTSPRGSEFEVASSVRFLKAGVFDAQNLVTVPHAKLVRKLGLLPADQLAGVDVSSYSSVTFLGPLRLRDFGEDQSGMRLQPTVGRSLREWKPARGASGLR